MDDPRMTTQLEAQLHQSILESIVEPDVVQAMDKVAWSETGIEVEPQQTDNPAPVADAGEPKTEPTQPDNPVATVPAATPEPVTAVEGGIDWEALREPNGLIVGKYKTAAEATRGVSHAVMMAKQAFTERDQLAQRIRELEAQRVAQPTPTQTVTTPESVTPQTTELDAVVDQIVQEGGLIDENTAPKLREAIRAEAQRVAREITSEADSAKVKEELAWTEVGTYMQKNHPDSVNFTQEINVFIASDPMVQKAVTTLLREGDRIGATEYAWLRYNAARSAEIAAASNAEAQKREIQLDAADKVRQEAVETARKDAGVMTTVASGVHETPNVGSNQEEIAAAAAEMHRTGLGERWRSLVFGQHLKGPMFD